MVVITIPDLALLQQEIKKEIVIEEVLKNTGSNERLSLLKSKLPANISYGEIRAVLLKGKTT